MEDRDVDLRDRQQDNLVTGIERIVLDQEFVVGQFVNLLALLFADAPVIDQAGAEHHADRDVRQAERCTVEHQNRSVLRVVLKQDLALFDRVAEPAGNVGNTRVGGVAVDVGFYAAGADEHISIASGRAGIENKVLLTLTDDLRDSGNRLSVGGEAAECDVVAVVDELGNRIRQLIHFFHDKTSKNMYFAGRTPPGCAGAQKDQDI